MKFRKIILSLISAPFIVACSGDDLEQYAQRADNADEIGFMLKSENITRSYSQDNPHPATMGAFGYHDLSDVNMEKDGYCIFSNTKVSYGDGVWSYAKTKYWPDYSAFNSFDFFGYMPYSSNASFTCNGSKYTLSFPVTLTGAIVTDETKLPLICNAPHHKDYPGDIVKFDMDQTMTGFQLKFKLGTKMSQVRDFEITKVVVKGKLPYYGVVSRTYDYSSGVGIASDIEWSSIKSQKTASSYDIANSDGSLLLSDDTFHEWGVPFFAIPSAYFAPTIEVTYNVKVDGQETVTRENVTNSIVFNQNNFANLKKQALTLGKINSLEIAIVPDHLYILADDDQYIGYLVME